MAHEISILENGQAEAAYAEQPAWHGLGVVLKEAPDSETMIKAAHLDWGVEMIPLFGQYKGGSKDGLIVSGEERRMVVRTDTNKMLGIVTDGYGLVQNCDGFRFLDSLTMDGVLTYESAMALRGGRVVVVVARMPEEDTIVKGDNQRRYILFQTSHDGSLSLHAMPTTVRVVCMNTLRMASQNIEGIRHSGNMTAKLDGLRLLISQFSRKFTAYRDNAKILADRPYTKEECSAYINTLFPPVKAEGDDSKHGEILYKAKLKALRKAFAHKSNQLPNIKGTWWQLFNAVTYYIDHSENRIYKGKTNQRVKDENRFLSVTNGGGAKIKNDAFDLALTMSKGTKVPVAV